jgi:hypothetical protein
MNLDCQNEQRNLGQLVRNSSQARPFQINYRDFLIEGLLTTEVSVLRLTRRYRNTREVVQVMND